MIIDDTTRLGGHGPCAHIGQNNMKEAQIDDLEFGLECTKLSKTNQPPIFERYLENKRSHKGCIHDWLGTLYHTSNIYIKWIVHMYM